jgi:hypothetical protein
VRRLAAAFWFSSDESGSKLPHSKSAVCAAPGLVNRSKTDEDL